MGHYFERMLNRLATVSRPTLVDAGHGASTQTLTPVATDVPCALRPLKPSERVSAAQVELPYDRVLYLLPDVDIARGDRVEVEGVSEVLRVVDVANPGYRDHHLEVMVSAEVD